MPKGIYKRTPKPIYERLMEKVAEDPSTGCWLWFGSVGAMGHGQIRSGGGTRADRRILMTHRVAWEYWRGPIPAGIVVCHQCDTPQCVNPDHLFLGTKADNSRDMVAKGRSKRGLDLPHAKFSDETVAAIRAEVGLTQAEIAAKYRASQPYVSQLRGRTKRAY